MTSLVLLDTPLQQRRRLISDVSASVGSSNVRIMYMPCANEGLVVPDAAVAGRNWTHNATPTGRLFRIGKGYAVNFNGTSHGLSTPDAADLSFTTGAADTAFTVIAVARVTDSALARVLVSKFGATPEWEVRINTADGLSMAVVDSTGVHVPLRDSTVAITQGVWGVFGATYSAATGGATAANDMTLYENGAVKASGATNDALYTRMTDNTNVAEIGASGAGTLRFFLGDIAFILVCAGNVSATVHAAVKQRLSTFYGLAV